MGVEQKLGAAAQETLVRRELMQEFLSGAINKNLVTRSFLVRPGIRTSQEGRIIVGLFPWITPNDVKYREWGKIQYYIEMAPYGGTNLLDEQLLFLIERVNECAAPALPDATDDVKLALKFSAKYKDRYLPVAAMVIDGADTDNPVIALVDEQGITPVTALRKIKAGFEIKRQKIQGAHAAQGQPRRPQRGGDPFSSIPIYDQYGNPKKNTFSSGFHRSVSIKMGQNGTVEVWINGKRVQ